MAHINPIKSKPLSPEGRDNYDRIFRKRPAAKLEASFSSLEQIGLELLEAYKEKKVEKAREVYHELSRQKLIDESA